LPVSARIKTSFPALHVRESVSAILHTSLNAADVLSFLVALVASWVVGVRLLPALLRGREPGSEDGNAALLAVATLYLMGRLAYLLLFSRHDVQGSYFVLAHVYNLLLLSRAADAVARRLDPRRASRALAATAGLVLVASLLLAGGKVRASMTTLRNAEAGGVADESRTALEIRALTRPDDVIYGGAFGLLGFLSDRVWLNGDGVANTYDYQQAIRDGRLHAWLRDNRVTYVAFEQMPGEPLPSGAGTITLVVRSPLYGAADSITVRAGDVLLRRRSGRGGGRDVCLASWHP
jgi:hypothetical protein